MKANARLAISLLAGLTFGLTAAAPARSAPSASGGHVQPGQVTYVYTSPTVSVYAGVQVGNNKTTTVAQHSAVNISSVAQVGDNVKTTVIQKGVANASGINQVGHHSSATVIQFGYMPSMLSSP